jgi:signal transduction histidine kinase
MSKTINWVAKWHWWAIGPLSLLFLSLEIFEITHLQIHLFDRGTLLIFLLLSVVIGLLIGFLLRLISTQTRAINNLRQIRRLTQEFWLYNDWNVLVTQLARFPGTVAAVDQASLFVQDPISNQPKVAAHWGRAGEGANDLCSLELFQKTLRNKPVADLKFCQWEPESSSTGPSSQYLMFCLPICYGNSLLAILLFKLIPGEDLTGEQEDIFRNIGDEFAVVIKAAQERKTLYEMRNSETALAERRVVSHYLHDHLGSNLGYLHFKLDELLVEKNQLSLEKVLVDLEHMRDAANESYDVVRGVLATIHPETTPVLNNLLLEYARKVSQRANFEMDFKTKGKVIPISAEVQRAIFYAFEESLSNIEKHASACKVNILADWREDSLTITISDDGKGFNPQVVNTDQHFGLNILNERMANVSGRVTLTTSENAGTTVNIWVPQPAIAQLGADLWSN